ncbi:MAG: family 10 glycosylhydrolase [Oscillospiraceae bacterium]|nr:family 10 glycosylhydrolase [Oscillospiraceae bacterium]
MKKTNLLIVLVLLIVLIVSSSNFFRNSNRTPDSARSPNGMESSDGSFGNGVNSENIQKEQFRAVWVATVFNLDFPSQQNLSAAALRWEIDAIVSQTAQLGLNAIVFQVRPSGDAFYKSDIFPWSQWLTGTQGIGIDSFDPLEYFIETCHENGIQLHAWLNPYRIIHTNDNSADPDTLAVSNPARLHPELTVSWTDSSGNIGLFYDPGLPAARELIISGIRELLESYDIDGIHFDDYFYPGNDFDDTSSFALYGDGMALADWRRDNVNQLISGIGTVIREFNIAQGRNVRWGVSPSGIWMNQSSDPLGVPTTSGQESYHALYADTRRWVTEEWVDYICPQIYWYIGFEIADFQSILNWWVELCGENNVDLYIGHAAYREVQNDQPPHWNGEMLRQLEMTSSFDVVRGNVFYRFNFMRGTLGRSIRDFYAETDGKTYRDALMLMDTLAIGFPLEDASVTAQEDETVGYNITGMSDPSKPLYMNGEEIANRTAEGFFFVHVTLEPGDNVFTFIQNGQKGESRTITRVPPPPAGTTTPSPVTINELEQETYAVVTANYAWVYPSNSSYNGSDWPLKEGQVDRVVAQSSNGLYKLASGSWISEDSITLSIENHYSENPLGNGYYRIGENYDIIAWQSDVNIATYASYDGKMLTLSFGMHSQIPELQLPEDLSETIFENVDSGFNADACYYSFYIRDDVKLEGYYTEYSDGEFRLYLKKRKALSQNDMPLSEFVFVIDPGHGGDDDGAIGPMGLDFPEKDITLINGKKLAQRLEALGATVYMTRDSDENPSVQSRIDLCYNVKPDLFISLHVNSIVETTNASLVRGFTVWYRNSISEQFAQSALDMMYFTNPRTNRNRLINQANFFVCRPSWVPSVILESSFISNLDDFIWLIDPIQQDKMAEATVDAILEYFQ